MIIAVVSFVSVELAKVSSLETRLLPSVFVSDFSESLRDSMSVTNSLYADVITLASSDGREYFEESKFSGENWKSDICLPFRLACPTTPNFGVGMVKRETGTRQVNHRFVHRAKTSQNLCKRFANYSKHNAGHRLEFSTLKFFELKNSSGGVYRYAKPCNQIH